MKDRRAKKSIVGRRKTDVPVKILEQFKADVVKMFQTFKEENTAHMKTTMIETVNGKIDDIKKQIITHNEKHEADMEELKPIIEAYKEKVIAERQNEKYGKKIIFWGAVVTGGTAIVYFIRKILGI